MKEKKFDEDFLRKSDFPCSRCSRFIKLHARGLCGSCYKRWLRKSRKSKEKHHREVVNKILKRDEDG